MLDFLLPLKCLGCGAHVPGAGREERRDPLCLDCALALRPPPGPYCPRCDLPRGTGRERPALCGSCDDWPPVLGRAVAAVALEPPADVLVQALKYGRWAEAATPMARQMVARLRAIGVGTADGVVPVPTTARRRRRRGYNQAEILAAEIARALDVELLDALARGPGQTSQVALQAEDRLANVQKAFGPGPSAHRVTHLSHLILVDDVLTTGATAGAAALTLAGLGAKNVTFVAFARTLPRAIAVSVADASSSVHL